MFEKEIDQSAVLATVVMSCFNEEETVVRAIRSILTQTFKEFEFIIVDDGSSDNTAECIRSMAEIDGRIRFYQNETNKNLPFSLNKAIRLSESDIIVRMDADDVSLPNRLRIQYDFLLAHPQIDVVGTNAFLINGQNEKASTLPLTNEEIYKNRYRRTVIIHPSVLVRKNAFKKYGYYDETLTWAEDRDLWLRWMGKAKFANIDEPLIKYTVKDRITLKIFMINHYVLIKNMIRQNEVVSKFPYLIFSIFSHIRKRLVG